ncbi:MAG TPA: ABC transporter ATP-binding protein [Chloroflexota bacterium]|nr:ABC transporter ATP-binding protein [Chloroflexota bacterium]
MRSSIFLRRVLGLSPRLWLANALVWPVAHLAEIAVELATRAYLDALSGQARVGPDVWTAIALFLGATVGRVTLCTAGFAVDSVARFTTSSALRRNVLAGVLRRPGACALVESPGETLNRFRDDPAQLEPVLGDVIDAAGWMIYAGSAIFILLRIDAVITLVAFLPLVAVVAVVQHAGTHLVRYRQTSRASTARVSGALGDLFASVQAIQLAGAEADAVAYLERLGRERRRAMLKDRLLREVLELIEDSFASLGTGVMLVLAAQTMQRGAFTVGDLSLFVALQGYVTWLTQRAGVFLASLRQVGVARQRLAALLPGEPPGALVAPGSLHLRARLPEVPPPAPPAPPERLQVLEVRDLTYRHPGSGRGVKRVAFRLTRGQLTVITGRTGAGKTTLLRVLLGLLPCQGGEILWNGRVVPEPESSFVPPRCAYVPQVPTLLSDTMAQNVLLGLAPGAELPVAIHTAVLEPDLAQLEQGLDTVVGPRGVRLSGGQVQRTAAARALVRAPELLVLDDLSSALDVETERTLWQRLFARFADATVLAVSHRPAVLQRADQVIVLEDGQVVARERRVQPGTSHRP